MGATFSITPTGREGYFIFHGSPGAVVRGQVRVTNVSNVAGRVVLSPVDATTGQTSGAVYLSTSAPRRGVGAWITIGAHTLALGPQRSGVVAFYVSVPRNITGGQHLGGLVAAPVQPQRTNVSRSGRRTFRVNIREISIVAVQVNVPGTLVQRITLSGVRASGRPGYQTLLIGLANAGNTLVKGAGAMRVSRAGGGVVLGQHFPLDTLVPDTSIAYPVYVRGRRLGPGHYVAYLTVRYGAGHVVRGTFPFTIGSAQVRETYGTTAPAGDVGHVASASSSIPAWGLVIGGLGLVGVSVGLTALLFRRRAVSR